MFLIRWVHREVKLRIQPLFSVLLLFISPCCATRSLYEIVLTDLYNNFAIPIQSEKLLRKVQRLSDDYEAKILDNLQRLSVASMRDLLAFLKKMRFRLRKYWQKSIPAAIKTHPGKSVERILVASMSFRGGPLMKYQENCPSNRQMHRSKIFGIFP